MSSAMAVNMTSPGQMTREDLIFYRSEGLSIHPLDTSCKEPQYAVTLANGKCIQVSWKLCDVLMEIDGVAPLEEVATNLSRKWDINVTPTDVYAVVQKFLEPHGLIVGDGHEQGKQRPISRRPGNAWLRKLLLQDFFFRFKLIPSHVVTSVARYTAHLYNRLLVSLAIIALLLVNVSAYREFTTLKDAGRLKLTDPFEALFVVLLVFFIVVFHEFGHASAVVRYGGTPDHIGFGLYFIYPALYANVNQSWRFTRKQRMVIDLGGIYFQVIASVVCYLAYLKTHRLAFLLAFLFVEFLGVYSLIPFFKFDGYWFVSDALGVPNLRKRAFELLSEKVLLLIRRERKRKNNRPDLDFPRATTYWVILYALSSLAFAGVVIWGLISYAPSRFFQYPGYLRISLNNLAHAVSNGSYSQAALVVILFSIHTLILVGLIMVGISLVASMYQMVKNQTRKRSYAARH